MLLGMRTFLILGVIAASSALAQVSHDRTGAIASALEHRDFPGAPELLRPPLRESPADPELWAMEGAAYSGTNNRRCLPSALPPGFLPTISLP
jgi:hypothetical protein